MVVVLRKESIKYQSGHLNGLKRSKSVTFGNFSQQFSQLLSPEQKLFPFVSLIFYVGGIGIRRLDF